MTDYTQVERDNAALTIREYAFGQMNMLRMLGDDDAANNLQEAINIAIAVLHGPVPDPETGLVPCGCGGKAQIKKEEKYVPLYNAECWSCGIGTGKYVWPDGAQRHWNRAMGYRK